VFVNGSSAAKPSVLTSESLLDLQRHVGNAIVSTVIERASAPVRGRGATVQRAPLSATDDPHGYTQAQGVTNVATTALTRLEVHGLTFGVSGGFQKEYGKRTSAEQQMTDESPDHMAVVIMPDTLDPDRPVQVVLHFHGWGFRQEKGVKDPYAGYLVASGRTASKKGDVRDVDQEHWAQQISAVVGARSATQPQIVAILVQGRGKSEFGTVPTYGYVQEVFGKVGALSGIKSYSIVLSAHSGGGATKLAPMVGAGEAQPADAATLKQDPARSASQGPADLAVLFDAEGIEDTIDWATKQIAALGKALTADPKNAKAILAASPKFRGYFAKGGSYASRYIAQSNALNNALRKLAPQWTDTTSAEVVVSDLFRIIEVDRRGVDHEHLIGSTDNVKEGALADALIASLNPIADRGKAYKPLPAPRPLPAPKKKAPANP
jgi:hypothetical protein